MAQYIARKLKDRQSNEYLRSLNFENRPCYSDFSFWLDSKDNRSYTFPIDSIIQNPAQLAHAAFLCGFNSGVDQGKGEIKYKLVSKLKQLIDS